MRDNLNIAVAISGGVDSYNALKWTLENYSNVVAVFLDFLGDGKQIKKVVNIADQFKIPIKIFNCKNDFKKKIENYFISEYLNGRTPNPCVKCNEHFKFNYLLNMFDYVVTGHYAKIVKTENGYFIGKGSDIRKDQSYFLARIPQNLLERIIFPLGDKIKSEIVSSSPDYLKKRKESQEICFIKENDYKTYLKDKGLISQKQGYIKGSAGNILGKHNGFFNFTVGQRKGLNIAMGKPYYVTSIDPFTNTVFVGAREETLNKSFTISEFLCYGKIESLNRIKVKVRYRSKEKFCKFNFKDCSVELLENEYSVTPGQLAVFYHDNLVIGSGWIEKIN